MASKAPPPIPKNFPRRYKVHVEDHVVAAGGGIKTDLIADLKRTAVSLGMSFQAAKAADEAELKQFIGAHPPKDSAGADGTFSPAVAAIPGPGSGGDVTELRRQAIAVGMSFQAAKTASAADLTQFVSRQQPVAAAAAQPPAATAATAATQLPAAAAASSDRKRAPTLPPPKPENAERRQQKRTPVTGTETGAGSPPPSPVGANTRDETVTNTKAAGPAVVAGDAEQYKQGAADALAENSMYEDLSVSFTEDGVCMVSVGADELEALRAFREHYFHLPEPPELLAEAGFGYDPEEEDLDQDPEAQIAALEVGLAFQTRFKDELVSQLREQLAEQEASPMAPEQPAATRSNRFALRSASQGSPPPPTPTTPEGSGAQTAAAVFAQYDTNSDGVLDADEVSAMIDAFGYKVDASYVGGVMEIFGKFDTDSNGTIDASEFPRLWEHLRGKPLVEAGISPPRGPVIPAPRAQQTAAAVFAQYDTNSDGVLDADEVSAMIDAIGYEVDASYVGGVMEIFGKFDTDSNGTIDSSEFARLWEHLGGEPLAEEVGSNLQAIPPPSSLPLPSQRSTGKTTRSGTKFKQRAAVGSNGKGNAGGSKKDKDDGKSSNNSNMAVTIGELFS